MKFYGKGPPLHGAKLGSGFTKKMIAFALGAGDPNSAAAPPV